MKVKTIAIIGAGFCGSMLAVHLMKSQSDKPLRVLLISRPGMLARGVAYSTRASAHVLNVPAGRMSALPDSENSFYEFAKHNAPAITSGSFVERRLYGDYLEWLLEEAIQSAPQSRHLHRITGEVVKLEPFENGEGARLLMDNTECFDADSIVMSTGNCARQEPSIAPRYQSFYASPRYIHDPWQAGTLDNIGNNEPVLLIGSGLTMLDVVLDLRDRGHQGPIRAVSRRGLLPQPHRDLHAQPTYDQLLSQHLLTTPTVRHYLRAVRDAVKQHALAGGDWRDVIGSLRSTTTPLWHALPLHERERFLRHVRPYWDVHRHRCAPRPGARLQAEIDSEGLELLAGRIIGYQLNTDSVSVHLRRRGSQTSEQVEVGSVINCTTPALDLRQLNDPLLISLRANGLLVPDALGTGMAIGNDGALIGHNGQASHWLRYVGPFLQARDWEATAVPELRAYVKSMADALLAVPQKTGAI